jgi:hypothetical protein
MHSIVRLAVMAVLAIVSAGCASLPQPSSTAVVVTTPTTVAVATPSASAVATAVGPSTQASETACPVTQPNGSTPPGEAASAQNHGAGGIWTVLWPDGTVIVPPDNVDAAGVLWMKFPWWRGPGVAGALQVSGRELTSGAMVVPDVPDYGPTGFQASGLGFPRPGCYEITAVAGDARLTVLTRIQLGSD